MELLMVTGLSGAGKSQVVNCLEDIGYYCVDNIPPRLMMDFISLAAKSGGQPEKAAFVVDVRGGLFFDELRGCLQEMEQSDIPIRILFIEASDSVLLRRYKETRRSHPLEKNGDVIRAIREEREKLSFVREHADIIIDSSSYKAADLYEEVKRLLLSEEERSSFSVTVQSFGYKYGVPQEADWVVDVRFLPNPFYVASLKKLTGKIKKVRDYVLRFEGSASFLEQISSAIVSLAPEYEKQGKYHLHLAVGCTGGRHRSVVIASELADILWEKGLRVNQTHRELENRK